VVLLGGAVPERAEGGLEVGELVAGRSLVIGELGRLTRCSGVQGVDLDSQRVAAGAQQERGGGRVGEGGSPEVGRGVADTGVAGARDVVELLVGDVADKHAGSAGPGKDMGVGPGTRTRPSASIDTTASVADADADAGGKSPPPTET
jgi:hypothetical protein